MKILEWMKFHSFYLSVLEAPILSLHQTECT
jgi:hypothetical protein